MLMLKLKKIQIRRERYERIKQLQILTGKEIIRETIPDYIEREDTEKEISNLNLFYLNFKILNYWLKKKNESIKNKAR